MTKSILLALALALGATTATADTFTFEPNVFLPNGRTASDMTEIATAAVRAVHIHGWRCDSISSMAAHWFGDGFAMRCNNFAYTYDFEDRGGRWIVTLR